MFRKEKGVSLIIAILSIIVLAIIGFFAYQQFFSHAGVDGNINFSRVGNLTINNPGTEENIWYLVYESPGSPANTAKLVFDNKSVCKNESNSCLDLIAGRRVNIKGIKNNNEALVREMEFLDSAEVDSLSGVDWETAIGFLNDCKVEKASVNYKKEVYITLNDGREMFTIESKDDSILNKVKEAEKKCGKIPFVTE